MSTWKVCEFFPGWMKGLSLDQGSFELSLDQSREASWKKGGGFLDDAINSTTQSSEGRGGVIPASTR